MADDQNVQTQDGQTQDTGVIPAEDSVPAIPVQTDIIKVEAAITNLVAAGEELFADEIAALKKKRDELLEKARAEAVSATQIEQSFAQKYGSAAGHIIEIVLLAAILGKLLGVF